MRIFSLLLLLLGNIVLVLLLKTHVVVVLLWKVKWSVSHCFPGNATVLC